MIKKITLILILLCMIASCGKKGDPKYEKQKKKAGFQNIILFKA